MPASLPCTIYTPPDASPSAPFAMADAVLPIEICERIIGDYDSDDIESPLHGLERGYASLITCTLTCKAWLSFSLYCIYRNVKLNRTEQCFLLLDVLAFYPHRAAWTQSLQLGDHDPHNPEYLPLGLLLAPRLFVNCREMLFSCSVPTTSYFRKIVAPLLSQHSPVTVLALDMSLMPRRLPAQWITLGLLIPVLRAMPQLWSLSLPFIRRGSTILQEAKQPLLCCPRLRSLTLCTPLFPCYDASDQFPPLGFFVCTALEELHITMYYPHEREREDCPFASLLHFVSTLEVLQRLRLSLLLDSSEALFKLPHERILRALSSVGSRRCLSSISLEFVPGTSYGDIGRDDLLAHLCCEAMQHTLESFPKLSHFHIVLGEDDIAFNEAWWEKSITDNLPGLKEAIEVTVQIKWEILEGQHTHLWRLASPTVPFSDTTLKENVEEDEDNRIDEGCKDCKDIQANDDGNPGTAPMYPAS